MNRLHQFITAAALAFVPLLAMSGPPPGKGKEDQLATFNMIASGTVTSDVECVDDPNADGFLGCKIEKDGTNIEVTLGEFFTDRTYDDGALGSNCFPDLYPDGDSAPTYPGTIQLADDQQGEDRAIYRFRARASDGETEIAYVLTFADPHLGWDNGFPPEVDETSTLYAMHWSLTTYNRDKKYGPCNGSGALSVEDFVTLDLTRID